MWHTITIEWYDFVDWYSIGITYNLSDMYSKAIENCWRDDNVPHLWEYLNGRKLKDAKDFLNDLLRELLSNPKEYKKYNPENGRWSYEWLCNSIMLLIIAAWERPDLKIEDRY